MSAAALLHLPVLTENIHKHSNYESSNKIVIEA